MNHQDLFTLEVLSTIPKINITMIIDGIKQYTCFMEQKLSQLNEYINNKLESPMDSKLRMNELTQHMISTYKQCRDDVIIDILRFKDKKKEEEQKNSYQEMNIIMTFNKNTNNLKKTLESKKQQEPMMPFVF